MKGIEVLALGLVVIGFIGACAEQQSNPAVEGRRQASESQVVGNANEHGLDKAHQENVLHDRAGEERLFRQSEVPNPQILGDLRRGLPREPEDIVTAGARVESVSESEGGGQGQNSVTGGRTAGVDSAKLRGEFAANSVAGVYPLQEGGVAFARMRSGLTGAGLSLGWQDVIIDLEEGNSCDFRAFRSLTRAMFDRAVVNAQIRFNYIENWCSFERDGQDQPPVWLADRLSGCVELQEAIKQQANLCNQYCQEQPGQTTNCRVSRAYFASQAH